MSDDSAASKKVETVPDPEDEDLSTLLNDALKDFGKPSASTLAAAANLTDAPTTSAPGAPAAEGGEPPFDPAMAQKAASEFENMLRQLAEVQKVMLQKSGGEPAPGTAGAGVLPPLGVVPTVNEAGEVQLDEALFAEKLLQNLEGLADKAKQVSQADNDQAFASAMQGLQQDESYEQEFLPFMQGLMSSLLSKDLMYPSLKEMSEATGLNESLRINKKTYQYPKYLEEHSGQLNADDLARYQKQVQLIEEACKEYEADKEDDSDEVKGKRFEKLIVIMQQMQLCGHPPEELVGSLPPGWGMDTDTGMPHVVDGEKAAESCSLM